MENNKKEETQLISQPLAVHTVAFPWEPKVVVTDGGYGRREGHHHKASTNGTTSELLVNIVNAENQIRELEFLASMVRAFAETWHDDNFVLVWSILGEKSRKVYVLAQNISSSVSIIVYFVLSLIWSDFCWSWITGPTLPLLPMIMLDDYFQPWFVTMGFMRCQMICIIGCWHLVANDCWYLPVFI